MFTGIIECLGEVVKIKEELTNLHFHIKSTVSSSLKIDQSIAHNGVCLTVVEIYDDCHVVTAIQETLDKSNLGDLGIGHVVNLERCTIMNGRLDGHIVQGHVDCTGTCTAAQDMNGSWLFSFEFDNQDYCTVEKGSICVNGVSLTVINSTDNGFSVAIIPYTIDHTSFRDLKVGHTVNLEFDIIGKYVAKLMAKTA